MIRHRPAGSGHPYADDTDQRTPYIGIAGESVRLGVRTGAEVRAVVLELEHGGVLERVELHPVATASRGRVEDGGHLASAQARLARRDGGWEAHTPPLSSGTYRYRFHGDDGSSTTWFDLPVHEWRPTADDAVRVIGTSRLVPGSVTVLTDGARVSRVRFALALSPDEHVTGFGERFDRLDHRGTSLDAVVFEQYKNQGEQRKTYLPMPFAHVVGDDGWGFHVRTTRRTWFDVGASRADQIVVEAETGTTLGDAVITLRCYDGPPATVLQAFLDEVGRPEELPDWVFRLWASGNEWNTQAEVMRQMDLHREHDIPVGTVVIEAWSDERTFTAFRDAEYDVTEDGSPHRLGDFRFPADGAWPDPKAMVDELHVRDVHTVLWQIPLLKARPHPTGQAKADAAAARRDDVLIRETAPDGSPRPYRNRGWWFPLSTMPDLTDERAAHWWTERRRYLVEEVGIDGFKTDGGEHAWGRDLVYLDGSTGAERNNTYPVAYAKAYGDLLRSAGKPPVTFSRAGFTGSQAHGAFWAGDENSTWDAFRWSILAGLSAAACGILYWGWDIAGFSGDVPSSELYLRAMAASTFVPVMQYHSEFNQHRTPSRDRTPWNIAERWNDDRVVPMTRRLVQLREKLVPYLVRSAREAIRTGRPLMAPLYFDHPTDPKAWEHPLQWMLGRDLLIAPVVEQGISEVDVYLPEGDWIDALSGQAARGGRVLHTPAPIGSPLVWVKRSAWGDHQPAFALLQATDEEAGLEAG